VPKTRRKISREEKVEEVLEIAERMLREGGYEALSMAAIARELGVAQNAVYWYFPSRDDLFVATMHGMLGEISARKPSKEVGDLERILWFTDQLQAIAGLMGAVGDRASRSPVVAEFAENLDMLLSRMLSNVLRPHVPAKELPLAVESFRATVEGTFVKGLGRKDRRRVLTFALRGLIDEQG
jgi:AcrR family transcriptional regulator